MTEFILKRDGEPLGLIDISRRGFVIPDQPYFERIHRIVQSAFECNEVEEEEGKTWYYFVKKRTATTEYSTLMELASLLGARGFKLSINRIGNSRNDETLNTFRGRNGGSRQFGENSL